MTHETDLIRRIDAMQATQVGPSDEWAKATKSGYNQAATDIAMNILKLPAAPDLSDPVTVHANMLRGSIAKLTLDQVAHLYGVDAICRHLAPMIVREDAALDVTAPEVAQIRADAESRFADWFRKNYPGPDTIIHKPDWHAPKIFRAALAAMKGDSDGRM